MGIEDKSRYVNDAVELLKELIATPRVSRDETAAADLMEERMRQWGLNPQREANNLWQQPVGCIGQLRRNQADHPPQCAYRHCKTCKDMDTRPSRACHH